MAVTFSGYVDMHVEPVTIASATLPGLGLSYDANGVLVPGGSRVDAILLSEIVSDQEMQNRAFIYQDIDWSYYARVGENPTVVKGFKGQNATGLKMIANAGAVAKGEALIMDSDTGTWKKNPTQGTGDMAIALEAIAANATFSGLVHIL